MKTFLWSVAGLFALLWSGLAWAAASLVRWTVEALSTGQAVELGKAATEFKFPAWVEPFLDTGLLTMLQGFVQWLLEIAGNGAPMAGAAVGWLVPVVWIVWAVGLTVLLGIAVVLHYLVKSLPRTEARLA
ncbi:hypothetical protein CDN99_17375 [Roseateles aquatilis]|uniref:Uncharacterized protein n=1 Tax=Roseateles aquatilis TaxID=431061 RepID=A0A246J7J1_9BURK|nr:hypothetical protein [Roseateles aquatilis]OWQ88610.1 hypothetical protein CDN99_17375 [Roseateles aquatilis]